MARIGPKSKCTPRTSALLLSEQQIKYQRSQAAWNAISALKEDVSRLGDKVQKTFQNFGGFSAKWDDLQEYLEFAEGGHTFLEALQVPAGKPDWARAGKKGKKTGPDYLYHQWIKGSGPGVFIKELPLSAKAVWDMPPAVRAEHHQRWVQALADEHLNEFEDATREFDEVQGQIEVLFREKDAHIMEQKMVIGCTTTRTAKYDRLIRAAKPDVVLVEEAGEILESHILTALVPTVKQLMLIGDHKQLRPKINNYALSVEKGEGFDLNCSLFERLIKQGASHATLHKQHRMAPEISVFARELTYPNLLDGPKTYGRPEILGLQDRVVFLNHGVQEDSDKRVRDRRDPSSKESKRNPFEAEMVLRCVKYLGQQGYASDRIVVLTPYLGQLRVLRELFETNQHDPSLSEMDKNELIRAGLISEAAAKVNKTPLRISTIGMFSRIPVLPRRAINLGYGRQLPGRRERHRHRLSHPQQRDR